jgi:hypothetical protein
MTLKKILIALAILFWSGTAMAEIPQSVRDYNEIVTHFGYRFIGEKDNTITYTNPDKTIIAAYNFSLTGGCKAGTFFNNNRAERGAITQILYINYATIQKSIGKTEILSNKHYPRKMAYLLDTIVTNLKRTPKTIFTYDDMIVWAEYRSDGLLGITLSPK